MKLSWAHVVWFVVLGFLAVVLLYPIWYGTSPHYRWQITMSNLKQLATATTIYQSDFDEAYPIYTNGTAKRLTGWVAGVEPYMKSYHLLVAMESGVHASEGNDKVPISFAMNVNLAEQITPVNPEATVLYFPVTTHFFDPQLEVKGQPGTWSPTGNGTESEILDGKNGRQSQPVFTLQHRTSSYKNLVYVMLDTHAKKDPPKLSPGGSLTPIGCKSLADGRPTICADPVSKKGLTFSLR